MKTKYTTHFNNAAETALSILKSERGLASELFLGTKALAEELGLDNIVAEFDKAMIDIETAYKDKLEDGMTLSSAVPAFKVRKSAIKRALKEGIDPTKFDSYRKFTDAVKKNKSGGGASENVTGGGGASSDSNTSVKPTDNVAKLHSVTNGMDEEVRAAYELLGKHLMGADKSIALDVLKGAEGALHAKLRKAGGRFAGVKKTGS